MYWLIPTIEKQTVLFRALWVMVFIGGIGRLISMLPLAAAPAPLMGFTALELLGAPSGGRLKSRCAPVRRLRTNRRTRLVRISFQLMDLCAARRQCAYNVRSDLARA
jgi:Domain of unknown function (DUF4345)